MGLRSWRHAWLAAAAECVGGPGRAAGSIAGGLGARQPVRAGQGRKRASEEGPADGALGQQKRHKVAKDAEGVS